MKVLVDSSAWIEYLEGSSEGKRVSNILKTDDIYSLSLIIAEVISKVKRSNKDVNLAYRVISSNSKIVTITPKIARNAGLLHADMKKKIKRFGLIDSLILMSARELNAKIITGDEHFKSFKETIFIK